MFNTLAILGLPAGSEWILIALIALLIFGGRLPQLAKNLGRSISDFKKGVKESENELRNAVNESDKAAEKKTPEEQKPSSGYHN
jgi:sec-independent protein translocase protein TatA